VSECGVRRPPEMFSASDQRENLALDQRPFVHHLGVAGTNHQVSGGEKTAVAGSVVIEVMPLTPIELEHESVADQEVHATDSGQRHLRPEVNAAPSQTEPGDRLQPGLATGIEQREDAPTTR